MTKFLAGVLSVIAAGVLLIAYGLLSPRASAFDMRPMVVDQFGRPLVVDTRGTAAAPGSPYGYALTPAYGAPAQPAAAYPAPAYPGYQTVSYGSPAAAYPTAQTMTYEPAVQRTVVAQPAPRRVVTDRVERGSRRDWKKTALIIGGSTAGAAGVGGLIGGKKGALIGAALGGGASTIYEATKR